MAEDTLYFREFSASTGFYNPATAYAGTPIHGRTGFGNLPKLYAALNRKNMRHTDNKGYPLCYVVEVEMIGNSDNGHTMEIFTAPETWVLKNAVRKWHIARNAMLERNESLGKVGEYGRTIRPYLSRSHALAGDIVPTLHALAHDNNYNTSGSTEGNVIAYSENGSAISGSTMNGGEWTYTRVASQSAYDSTEGTGNMSSAGPPVDSYALVLTGDHNGTQSNQHGAGTDNSTIRTYTHVSMMRSYLESRRNASSIIQTSDGMGTITKEPSPLADMLADSLSATESREIIQDIQREKPPYDVFSTDEDNSLTANDALDLVSKCYLSTSTTYHKDKEVIRVPMGLFHIRSSATAAIGSTSNVPEMRIRLLGIDKCQG